MERVISCYSLAAGFQDPLVQSVNELGDEIRQYYPHIGSIKAESFVATNLRSLEQFLFEGLRTSEDPSEPSTEFARRLLLILMPAEHAFVEAAIEQNPLAQWGIAVPRRYAVAWVNNKFLWWHETLHLLNAKDCYNRFGIHKCQEPHCIMQAMPSEFTCGGRLFLCSKNQSRLADELR